MPKLAKFACYLILFASACWAQGNPPQAKMEDLLTKGKQLYIQEGPKAALPPFEEALKQ